MPPCGNGSYLRPGNKDTKNLRPGSLRLANEQGYRPESQQESAGPVVL